jgi:hypothetical protein
MATVVFINRLLHAHGLGPEPHVLYLICQLAIGRGGAIGLVGEAPGLLEEASKHRTSRSKH